MSSYIFGKIDMSGYNIEEDVKYLNTIHKQPEEYDEFGQGYWKNISLYNASGSETDSQFRNTVKCHPTPHMKKC
jgi:hypothetical protein